MKPALSSLALRLALSAALAGLCPVASAQPGPGGPQPILSPLRQIGFEVPDLGPNNFAYTPAGSAWTFTGSAGLAANGSGMTSANPAAPQGDQVAFLQGTGKVSQPFSLAADRYRVTFKAAQRLHGGLNTQVLSVRLDGAEIAQIKPASSTYQAYTTHSFVVTPGSHTLEIAGLNPSGGDHTALIDEVKLQAFGAIGKRWSDPATWAAWGATLPGTTTVATIPAGQIVLLDTHASAKTLQIDGELHCMDQDISLAAESVMVHGRFECGSAVSPFLDDMTLTLITPPTLTNPQPMGDKVLGAMMPGVIELHGEPRVSWTQLGATAHVGDTTVTLASTVDWHQGDQIVIAPTGETYETDESDVLTLSSVSSDGRTLTFTPALAFNHWGEETLYNNPQGTHSWTLDERAEVGLLTRNLKIQGDAASDGNGIGGHMMTMAGTTIHASGIELYRMGQKSLLGRYPFHWHLLESAPGQSIENSSIHKSFNRCVTVHGTHDTRVADNVCYDFMGHGYFLEDGFELRNVFEHNLGVWARKPAQGEQILETDIRSSEASNGPAVFWIGHPDNTYLGNAAAGSQGTGFWYGMVDQVTGLAAQLPAAAGVNPRKSTFGKFDENRVHSSRQGFSSCRDPEGGPFGMEPPNEALIEHLTVSNVPQGVWPCSPVQDAQNHRFVELIVANSANGMQAPDPMTFEDSLFVAYSDNAPSGAAYGGGLDWRAIQVYDQGFLLDNVHFVNYDRPAMTVFHPGTGAHKLTQNRADGISFTNSPNVFLDPHNFSQPGYGPAYWGDVIHDLEGNFVGDNSALVNDHPLMYDASCSKPIDKVVAGYVCPYRYGQFRSEHFSNIAPITVMRSDGVHDTAGHIEQRFITEIILNGGYHYTWRYLEGMKHKKIQLSLHGAIAGDAPVYELLDMPRIFSILTAGWSQAQDLSALMTGPGRQYYYRGHSLFLKMLASGPDWHAQDLVDVCVGAPPCNPGLISLGTLPTVAITTPLDGERVNAGSPVSVQANVSDPDGIKSATLYVGVDLVGADLLPPYIWTLTGLAPGSYPLKLVAEDNLGRSYTAVQQLFVGEPLPRIEITQPLDRQTFDANVPFALAMNVVNWTVSPTGRRLRLLIDDYDAGELTSTGPLSIRNLAQGRHELEIALVEADGTTLAISDRVTIYSMHGKLIADFEDGVDERGSFTAVPAGQVPVSFVHFAWGTAAPLASRADGEDDINFFDMANNGGSPAIATYRLALAPAESWLGYTKLEIKAASALPFEVWIEDQNQGLTNLGSWTPGVPLQLPANSTLIDQVIAIELRHPESSALAPPNSSRNHLQQIRLLP